MSPYIGHYIKIYIIYKQASPKKVSKKAATPKKLPAASASKAPEIAADKQQALVPQGSVQPAAFWEQYLFSPRRDQ